MAELSADGDGVGNALGNAAIAGVNAYQANQLPPIPVDSLGPVQQISASDIKSDVQDIPQTISLATPSGGISVSNAATVLTAGASNTAPAQYDPSTMEWRADGYDGTTTADPAQAKDLPATVVTEDGRTGDYLTALNLWAYSNHLPAPTAKTMQDAKAYYHQMYAKTAPAYGAWVAASTSHILPTEEERSLMARQYIFSDPTGQRQADFFNYSDKYWLKLAAIPAAAGAGLGVVGGVLGTEAVVASAKVGGSIGAVNGYISGGWKGAVVGGIFGTGLGAGVGTAVDLVEAGTLLRGAAFVVGNGATAATTTIATNAVVGDPLGKDVGWSIAVGMASIFGSGAVVAETLGEAIIGNGALGAIRTYANSLSVIGTAADPNSSNGLNPQPDNNH